MSTPVPAPSQDLAKINSSTLIIGGTGSGKSTLLATAAEYVWETFGHVSVLCSSDPGGFPDKLKALINLGIIWAWRMQTRGLEYSFETAQLAARGYLPAQIDPKTGITPKGVKLVPPVVHYYVEHCGSCGQVAKRVTVQKLLGKGTCPHCQKSLEGSNRVVVEQQQTPGFERVGARFFDGLTSISDWYMQDMSHRKELGGEEGSLGGKITSGDLVWRSNNRAQVGFAQNRVHELVLSSLEIPNLDIMPIWTAIANETSDAGGLTIIGPKFAGDAKTEIGPSWFGNCFEARLETNERGQKVRTLYLSEFIDANNRRHLLKHRGDPRFMPEKLEDPPYSDLQKPTEICVDFHLGRVFRLLDESMIKTQAEMEARYPDAPGLASVPTAFGGGLESDAPATSPATATRPVVRAGAAPAAAGGTPAPKSKAIVKRTTKTAVAPQEAEAPPTQEVPQEAPTPEIAPAVVQPPVPATPTPVAGVGAGAAPVPGAWAPPAGVHQAPPAITPPQTPLVPAPAALAPPRAPAAAPRRPAVVRPASRPTKT